MQTQTEAQHRVPEQRLYLVASVMALLVVIAGFARTYYLKNFFDGPPLSTLLHLHGLLMSSWFALVVVQVRLVAAHRVDVHRQLGKLGAVLAVLVLLVGIYTAVSAARLGHSPGPPPLIFLVIPLGDMLVFAALVGSGLYFRNRRRDAHRRLMLLASVGLLTAAIVRIPVPILQKGGIVAAFSLTCLGVIICVLIDTVHNRRLHPAFLWGGLLVLLSWPARLALSGTAVWMQFARWITAG